MPARMYPPSHKDPALQHLIDDFEEWRATYDWTSDDDESVAMLNAFIAGALLAAHDHATAAAAVRLKEESE